MTLNNYLTIMVLTTIVCWICWGFILLTVNPEITNWIGFILFYASLFLSLIGTTAIAGFLIRFKALKQDLAFRAVKEAFRQSFLFAFLSVVVLILLSKDMFTWLNLLFLFVGLSILEFFMLSYDNN